MDARLVNKLTQLYCNLSCLLKTELDIKNYGLKNCLNTGISPLDGNPKFVKIVTDLLKFYNNYTAEELEVIDTKCNPDPNCTIVTTCECTTPCTCNSCTCSIPCTCNIFKIIKNI